MAEGIKIKQLQPGQPVQVDMKNATQKLCGGCANPHFFQVFRILELSALMSPTGQPLTMQQAVYICTKCGATLDLPNQLGK